MLAETSAMRWRNSEEYDRTNARYIRRRRWRGRLIYRRIALGAATLILVAGVIFITFYHGA